MCSSDLKESDRIEVMASGLRALGVELETFPDGIRIRGRGTLEAGAVDSHGDHRIAMAFSVASLRAAGPVAISDCANVATSFPAFRSLAASVGLTVEETISRAAGA